MFNSCDITPIWVGCGIQLAMLLFIMKNYFEARSLKTAK